MTEEESNCLDSDFESIKRRIRLVLLLEASREAGIDPIPTQRLHLVAYLANVLSPVWDMPYATNTQLKADGSILKLSGGPFYPDLQADLDRLVGMGVVMVEGLCYRTIDDEHYRLEGSYRVNPTLAEPILTCMFSLLSEARIARCIRELVLALSSLSDKEMDRAATQDATYSDPTIGPGNVIDFGEWTTSNFSSSAAIRAGEFVQSRADIGASEKVHLYIRHLRRRLQGEQ